MKVKLKTIKRRIEDFGIGYVFNIHADGTKAGQAHCTEYLEDSKEQTYAHVHRIDVDDNMQGQGIGTQALILLADRFGCITAAAATERVQALYRRLGTETNIEASLYMDAGYGVYQIESDTTLRPYKTRLEFEISRKVQTAGTPKEEKDNQCRQLKKGYDIEDIAEIIEDEYEIDSLYELNDHDYDDILYDVFTDYPEMLSR